MELFLIKLVKKLWTAYHIWATLFQNFEWDTIYQTLGYGQILVYCSCCNHAGIFMVESFTKLWLKPTWLGLTW